MADAHDPADSSGRATRQKEHQISKANAETVPTGDESIVLVEGADIFQSEAIRPDVGVIVSRSSWSPHLVRPRVGPT